MDDICSRLEHSNRLQNGLECHALPADKAAPPGWSKLELLDGITSGVQTGRGRAQREAMRKIGGALTYMLQNLHKPRCSTVLCRVSAGERNLQMVRSFLRLVGLAWIGSLFAPIVILGSLVPRSGTGAVLLVLSILAGCVVMASALFYRRLNTLQPALELSAGRQAEFLDSIDSRYIDLAIAGSAALSLFLELAAVS